MPELKLAKGTIKVDDQDAHLLTTYKWHISDQGYAVWRSKVNGVKKTIRLHRLVNQTPDGLFTDHRNHDRLDNRRSNLRTVTQQENMANFKGAKGYCWDSSRQLWMVRYRGKYIGRYQTEQEARDALRKAAGGQPKKLLTHPRRRYLPDGVCFMKSMAQRGSAAYYIRPLVNGKRVFQGYFSTIAEAEAAYTKITATRRVAS